MKKILFTTVVILFFVKLVYSQQTDTLSFLQTRTFTFSYFGNNLLNPGLKSSINFTLSEETIKKTKTRKNNKIIDKSYNNKWILSGNIGFFWHPQSHVAVFNYYLISMQKLKLKSNRITLFGIGPGIYRSFYPETYTVNKAGTVDKIILGGRMYFAPVFSFGSGKEINNYFFTERIFTTNLMFLFDYNTGIVPLLNLELAFTFDFKR